MHEAQVKEETQEKPTKARATKRAYMYFALVKQRDEFGGDTELLEFDSKSSLRSALSQPKYDAATVRVLRGYELNVNARVNLSFN